jgi:hypothetical protein
MALAFHALKVPLGSVWYSAGLPSGLKPTISVLMPNGRTPPLCMMRTHREQAAAW